MARGPSPFYYQNPAGAIAQSMGRALFGDPTAAAAQRKSLGEEALRQAQTAQATAHGDLYTSQAAGQGIQNSGRSGISGFIGDLVRAQHPTAAPGADALAPLPDVDPQAVHQALGNVIASLAQTQDNPNIGDTMGSLGAFLGDDEFARRGLVASGHTPGKDFAITPERADVIRNDEQGAIYDRTIDGANIRATTARRGQDVSATTQRRGQDVSATTARRGQDVRAAKGETGFSLISDVLPGARMTSGERSPEHNREVGGVSNSRHLPGDGIEAYDVAAGTGARTFADAHATMKARYGPRLVEARDETGRVGPNGVPLGGWHFAVQQGPKPAKTAADARPRGISAASNTMIDSELNLQLGGTPAADKAGAGFVKQTQADGGAYSLIKNRTVQLFQQTGNHVGAVQQAIHEARKGWLAAPGRAPGTGTAEHPARKMADSEVLALRREGAAAIARGKDPDAVANRFKELSGRDWADTPPAPGARKSPRDGLWYVQQGKHADGSPAYARVDG